MAWQHIGSLALSAPKRETPAHQQIVRCVSVIIAQRLFGLELAIYLAPLKLDAHSKHAPTHTLGVATGTGSEYSSSEPVLQYLSTYLNLLYHCNRL